MRANESPIIAVDRGASFTDFGVLRAGRLVETESLAGRAWPEIAAAVERLERRHPGARLVFTGSAAGMPEPLARRAQLVGEIDAVGRGGAALAGLAECLVVSAGTGTAVVHFKEGAARHVGGTGVGGGTITGLGTLLLGTADPEKIEALAAGGRASGLNLTLADLGYTELSFLGAEVTASNFAAPKSRRAEDLAAAILSLVAETIGIVASLCAREAGCAERIVMVGKVSQNRQVRRILELVGGLYRTTFIFPASPGYATVLGAALKHGGGGERS